MTNQQTRAHQSDPSQLTIALDPEEIECSKTQRVYHLNVIQIPALRLLGFCLLIVCIFFHNWFLLKSFSLENFLAISSVMIGYALISWIILYVFFDKSRHYDLGFVFLVIDVFIWTLAIYFSGSEKSLLFWLMVMRVADQINTNFKRAFFFAHLSIASYIGMLLYLMYVDHRTISFSHEFPKILAIYASNLYIAMTARASDEHRHRTATAVRVARELIVQLNEQSRQLEESKAHVEQLSRQNELILRSAGEGIYGLDLNGRATFVNPAVVHMSGYAAEELLGQPIHALLYHSKRDGTPSPWEACPVFATLRGGTIHRHAESILWRKDGTYLPVEYVSTPIREGEEIVGAVVTFNDITERQRAEKALRLSSTFALLSLSAA